MSTALTQPELLAAQPLAGKSASVASRSTKVAATGEDPLDFLRANRIHVQHGSLFVDPYLVLHPRELDPTKEDALRRKLTLTYSINNPSFYEKPKRTAVALHLGSLVPVSLSAKRSQLMEAIKQFNEQTQSGKDPELTRELNDKHQPFAAVVRDTMKESGADPVGMEVLKNGIAVYMLLRDTLTQNHYLGKLTEYTPRLGNADQVLASLADKIGVSPIAFREAALKGGIDGIGKLLKRDPKYIADVKQLAEHMAANDFGYNLIEHWHIGRQLLGMDATLEDKITVGMDARITAKMDEYRKQVKHHYDIPEPLQPEEKRVAAALSLVEPIQRKLMYALGYEICFSPEVTADEIAFHKGVYGLHRKAANDLNDFRGTYRVYFSGKGDLEGSMRTLVHEVAHNLWPNHFSHEDVQKIDALAASDAQRFAKLNQLMQKDFARFESLLESYKTASADKKPGIIAQANQAFATYGVTVDGLFPHLKDAHQFRFMVEHAVTTLDVEGERYSRSGYDSPQERFREVLSRFAELKQVRYRTSPSLLAYLAPGLTEIFDQHYLPHLERVYQDLKQGNAALPAANDNQRDSETQAPAPEQQPEEKPKVREQPVPKPQPLAFKNSSVSVSPEALSLQTGLAQNPLAAAALRTLQANHHIRPSF